MKTHKEALSPPRKSIGGTTSQGKNSKVDYKTTKSTFKMKKSN